MIKYELPMTAAELGGNQYSAAGALLDVIKRDLWDYLQLPPKDTVLAAAAEAYDLYVAPIDIPYVPNLIEPLVDQQLRSMFLASVDSLYDAIAARVPA